jgi:dihydropteroate synthase
MEHDPMEDNYRASDGAELRAGSASLPDHVDPSSEVYLKPLGLRGGAALAWRALEVIVQCDGLVQRFTADDASVLKWSERIGGAVQVRVPLRLNALQAPRAELAGLQLDRPLIMGVLNVTPDSFSDAGDHAETDVAIAAGRAMIDQGADIVDVGGESTRPRATQPVEQDERARALPVIKALAGGGGTISVDTRRAAIMEDALEAGAAIINDVSALTGDPQSMAVVAASTAPVILMHMQGTPETMQDDPSYQCAPLDIFDWLDGRIKACEAAGIARQRIIVDPGIGFGKTVDHNLSILRDLAVFHGLGCALAVGVSRKAFIGRLSGAAAPKERLPGSLAAMLHTVAQGTHIVRVHDVAETAQALAIQGALFPPDDV